MSEKDDVYSNATKYGGIFNFKDFYQFCYDFLSEELGLDITEKKYEEKIKGPEKEISVEWATEKKLTDYFKANIKVEFAVKGLKNVEINQGGAKVKTNDGSIKIKIKGTLEKDYNGKFEVTSFQKFLRGIYEKWVIPSRVDDYQTKVFNMCEKFLKNAKAYLDLEGER